MPASTLPKLLVTGADLAPQALALLGAFEVVYTGPAPQPQAVEALCAAHNPVAVIVRYGKFTAAMMDAAPALRVVSKHGSGIDTIDQSAAQTRGIAVVAASGANADAVAEHALALLLAAAKSVVHLNARMHGGHWDKATHKSLELRGKTAVLVGLGAIGLRFAKLCKALGMRVLGHDPFANVDACAGAGVELMPLEAALPHATVWSLHCPLTPENAQFVNAQTLALCPRGVIFVNTARGGLVDEAALLAAVQSGQVGTAALDSFAVEPFGGAVGGVESSGLNPKEAAHPFQNQAGFLLSPHIGGVTSDAYINMGVGAAQNVLAALGMQPAQSV